MAMTSKAASTAVPAVPMSALIVDDDAFSQEFFAEMLLEMNISNIHRARNGFIALRTLAELTRAPDFLICDVFMPDMDGIEFLSELAKKNYRGGIVLVSGVNVTMLDIARQLALGSGLNLLGAHAKPVSMATLAATLGVPGMVH